MGKRKKTRKDFLVKDLSSKPHDNPNTEPDSNCSTSYQMPADSKISLIEAARNTERHHAWTAASRLRDRPLNFVGAERTQVANDSTDRTDFSRLGGRASRSDLATRNENGQLFPTDTSDITSQGLNGPCNEDKSYPVDPASALIHMKVENQTMEVHKDLSKFSRNSHKEKPPIEPGSLRFTDSDEDIVVFSGRNNLLRGRITQASIKNEQVLHGKGKFVENPNLLSHIPPSVMIKMSNMKARTVSVRSTSTGLNGYNEQDLTNDKSHHVWQESSRSESESDCVVRDYMNNVLSFDSDKDDYLNGEMRYNSMSSNMNRLSNTNESEAVPSFPIRHQPVERDFSDSSLDTVNQATRDLQEVLDDIGKPDGSHNVREIPGVAETELVRLLAKQEELELEPQNLLVAGIAKSEGTIDDQNSKQVKKQAFLHAQRKSRNHGWSQVNFSSASHFDGVLSSETWENFDIMDRDRQSIQPQSRVRRVSMDFELEDSELEETLVFARAKDKLRKGKRKRQREELRSQGLIGKHDKLDMKAKYAEGMNIHDIRNEIHGFLSSGRDSLSFTPMEKRDRKMVHEFASAFNLKSKSVGSGNSRYPRLIRTSKTRDYDDSDMKTIEARILRRFSPRLDKKSKSFGASRGGRPAEASGGHAAVGYRDGDIVGASAPELGSENKGRAILEKMGWSTGTALGAINNKGMLQPVSHVVKNSRAGLG